MGWLPILHRSPHHHTDMWFLNATLLIFIVFLFLCPIKVSAQPLAMLWMPDESEVSAAGKRVSLALSVNGVDKGVIVAVLRTPEILVLVDDLKSAGLETVEGERVVIDGKPCVLLSSLAPKVTYIFDKKEIALRLTADPTLLGTTTMKISANQPHGMTYLKSTSAFLNYAFNAANTKGHNLLTDFNSNSLFTEGGLSIDGNLLYSSVSLNTEGHVIRGLTNLTVDNPVQLTRLIVGDTQANTGLLGGGVYLGGIGFSRNFALNPYFIPNPMQQLSGQVTMPSTADIYVNGVLVKTLTLQPGQFNLQDLPVSRGASNTQVIIRNAFGQQEQINAPYYLSTQVLKEGLNQYTYNLGFIRDNMGTESWDYGPLAFAAGHLYGFTDWLTAGAFFQADNKVVAGGPQLALRTPWGQIGLWGALSGGDQAAGGSAAATYSYITSKYSFGGDITLTSNNYSTLSLRPEQDRALTQADAFFSFNMGRLGVSPTFRYSDYRDSGRIYSASIVNTYRLSSSINLQMTLTRTCPDGSLPQNTEIFMALNYFFGNNTVATVSYDRQSNSQSDGSSDLGTIQVQKSLPVGTGYGYLVQGQLGEQAQEVANIKYQGPYGLYEFDYNRSRGQDSTRLAISGGLAGIDGHVFATRAIRDSYGLIKVPGVKDVTGYNSNQSVGKTDSNGNLLVPDLLSYYGNDLSINDKDIPIDYSVETTRSIVATPYRGGGVVTFPVRRLQAFTGRLEIEIKNAGKSETKSVSEEKETIVVPAAPIVTIEKSVPVVNEQKETKSISEEAVRGLVNKWLSSWQSGDMKTYRSCYAADFQSKGMDLNAWISYKVNVRKNSKHIKISIDNLQISMDENTATAVFNQYYSSSLLKDSCTKKLELRKINDKWEIYRETVGGIAAPVVTIKKSAPVAGEQKVDVVDKVAEKPVAPKEEVAAASAPAVIDKDLAPVSGKQNVIPVYGDLTITVTETESAKSKEFRSPISEQGKFYLENIPAGSWPAVIDYQNGQCKFIFVVPSSQERIVKMETVKCVLQ